MSQEKQLNPVALLAEDAAKTLGIPGERVEGDLAAAGNANRRQMR